jgi:hypothetical protein
MQDIKFNFRDIVASIIYAARRVEHGGWRAFSRDARKMAAPKIPSYVCAKTAFSECDEIF